MKKTTIDNLRNFNQIYLLAVYELLCLLLGKALFLQGVEAGDAAVLLLDSVLLRTTLVLDLHGAFVGALACAGNVLKVEYLLVHFFALARSRRRSL